MSQVENGCYAIADSLVLHTTLHGSLNIVPGTATEIGGEDGQKRTVWLQLLFILLADAARNTIPGKWNIQTKPKAVGMMGACASHTSNPVNVSQ